MLFENNRLFMRFNMLIMLNCVIKVIGTQKLNSGTVILSNNLKNKSRIRVTTSLNVTFNQFPH